jgi:hypothetical protein
MKLPEAFRDAEALAEFANLSPTDSASVAYFKENYPEFAPCEWWDYKFEDLELIPAVLPASDSDNPINPIAYGGVLKEDLIPIWQNVQDEIQRAWIDRFQFENVFGLTQRLKAVFIAPSELVLTGSHLYLPDGALYELGTPKLYTFHKAVLYLNQHSWRPKICQHCGKYFVANHPQRDSCPYPDARGETCRQKRDKKRKLDYYFTTGKHKRQANNKRKSNPRLPGSRRKKESAKIQH